MSIIYREFLTSYEPFKEPYFCLAVAPGFCLRTGLTGEGIFAARLGEGGESIAPTLSSNIQNSPKKGEKYKKNRKKCNWRK
jgi:hypothetical protein